MSLKILESAVGRRGSAIVAIGGALRVVDDSRPPCHGYRCGCVCPTCKERADSQRRVTLRQLVVAGVCGCDRAQPGGDGDCGKCGHPIVLPKAA